MDDFYRYGLSRRDLNMRAAHSLYRAGWMLGEINGVLHDGYISPEDFQIIQRQVTALDQLQRKFGPPATSQTSIADVKPAYVNTKKCLTIKVMNRGVEEAAAVLNHHGWTNAQIRGVLKLVVEPFDNNSLALLNKMWIEQNKLNRYVYPRKLKPAKRKKLYVFKTLFTLFWFGGLIFLGVSLILHML